MYVYLTSNEFVNGKCRFVLPKGIAENTDVIWNVALLDIMLHNINIAENCKFIDILTPICKPGIVDTRLLPILNRIYTHQMIQDGYVKFDTPKYIELSMASLDFIDVILVDDRGHALSFEPSSLTCTLHFVYDH